MRRGTVTAEISLLALIALGGAFCLRGADSESGLTLSQFRALIRPQNPLEDPEASRRQADDVFSGLLAAQGREAAARQSLDRLSGWNKAAQARLAAQNAAALDVEMLRFSEAKVAVQLARLEAEHRRALQQANALLGRPPGSPLVGLTQTPLAAAPDKPEKPKEEPNTPSTPGRSTATLAAGGSTELAKRRAQFEKELLPQGRDLLAKMYQSYLFGGIPLSALLWQEQEVYRTELQYRLLLVEAETELLAVEKKP